MDINKIDFADAKLINIKVEFNRAILTIRLDNKENSEILLICEGLIGLDNLIIWDDMDIFSLKIKDADLSLPFLKKVFKIYPKNIDYGARDLTDPIKDVQITLSNNEAFHIYCQNILINESLDVRKLVDLFIEQISVSTLESDAWNDFQLDDLIRILKQFTSTDWNNLIDILPLKSKVANDCILDCLTHLDGKFVSKCLKKLK